MKVLRSSADRHLYDSEFQTKGALIVNAFADNASVIFGTKSNNLSDERNERVGWYRSDGSDGTLPVGYVKDAHFEDGFT